MRAAQTPPSLMTLILSTSIAVLALNMFLPSLAHIAEDFEADYALANLSVSGFLMISAAMQIIMGPLSDRFGRRPVMLWSFLLFVVASVGCALAQDIWAFLGWRLLQSAVVCGQVVNRAVIRDMHGPQDAAAKLGQVQMVMAVAPMLGPMLGGALDLAFGWRASFWFYTLFGAGVLWLLWADLGETNAQPSTTMGAQIRTYPELFRSRRFWGYSICIAFSIGGFFSFITGAPLVAAAWFDLSPAVLGLGIGIITGGFMVGNFFTGILAKRMPLIRLILAGRMIALIGPLAGIALFWAGQGTAVLFFAAAVCVGLGNGLTVANAASGLMSVRPNLAGSASGLSGAMTVGLGAVLTSATGSLIAPQTAPYAVLGMMAACSLCALGAAFYVRHVDLRDPLPSSQ